MGGFIGRSLIGWLIEQCHWPSKLTSFTFLLAWHYMPASEVAPRTTRWMGLSRSGRSLAISLEPNPLCFCISEHVCQDLQSDFVGDTNFSQEGVGGLEDNTSCSNFEDEEPDFIFFLLEIHCQFHVFIFFQGVVRFCLPTFGSANSIC